MTPDSSPQLPHESQTKVPPRYLLCIFLEPMSKPPRHLLQPLCHATWNQSELVSRRHRSPPPRHKASWRLAGRASWSFLSPQNLIFKHFPPVPAFLRPSLNGQSCGPVFPKLYCISIFGSGLYYWKYAFVNVTK